jgi:hypothetical protein
MELRTPNTPIDDPFFAAVRRRHPEVDVVLLPAPGPADGDPTPGDEVAATLARVAIEAGGIWSAVAPDAAEQPDARLAFGVDESSVRAVARVVASRDDGFAVLLRLRHELGNHGWAVRRPPGAGVERLTGVLDESDLTASYAEASGTLLLTLASASMPVGRDRARELTQDGER